MRCSNINSFTRLLQPSSVRSRTGLNALHGNAISCRSVVVAAPLGIVLQRMAMHQQVHHSRHETVIDELDPRAIRDQLIFKIDTGTDAEVRELVQMADRDINKANERGETPLIDLILKATLSSREEEYVHTLQELLASRFIDVNVPHKHTRYTALHLLVNHNSASSGRMSHDPRLNMMRLLIKKGANVNALSHHQQTPLHFAAHRGDARAVQLLLDQFDIDISIVDSKGKTACDLARAGGYRDVVEMLEKKEFKEKHVA